MFGAACFVCTFSILAAIVATNPTDVPDANINRTAQRYVLASVSDPYGIRIAFKTRSNRAGIGMIFCTTVFFSLSFGPVSWVLASEVNYQARPFSCVCFK